MAENYDDISCEDVIYSEDYRDYIKEYFQDFSSIVGTYHPVCIEAIGSRYAVDSIWQVIHLCRTYFLTTISACCRLYMVFWGQPDWKRAVCSIFSQITLSESERFRCDDRCH